MKHEFSRQLSEKYSNIKFHEDLSVGAELFHADRRMDGHTDGVQTDRHGEANSSFSHIYERTQKLLVFL
jgi:hypothetical protein